MRLTCPNCGAEYEVPDEVIPTSGRDVQCSNCGDTWYQYHPDHMPEGAEEEAEDFSGQDFVADPDVVAPDFSGDDSAEDDLSDEDDEDEDGDLPEARQPLRRRSLAPDVQSILREEAEYEERARGQDPLESQPDLGLGEPEAVRREDKADSRLARLRKQSPDEPQPEAEDTDEDEDSQPAATGSSRRNLLPDIEEINSTLRRKGDTGRSTSERSTKSDQRRGTRRSFVAILALLAVGATLYLQAPSIGKAIPQLQGPMMAYVDAVDKGRGWLDVKASALAEKLDEMAAEPETAPAPTE